MVAIDGSTKVDAAGWGCLIVGAGTLYHRCYGLDCSSTSVETHAIERVAINVAAADCEVKKITFLVDKMTVVRRLQQITDKAFQVPRCGFEQWTNIIACLEDVLIQVIWVPSHGKKEEWVPSTLEVGCATTLRDYNETADSEADKGRALAEREEQTAAFRQRCCEKKEWYGRHSRRLVEASKDFVQRNLPDTTEWIRAYDLDVAEGGLVGSSLELRRSDHHHLSVFTKMYTMN